MCRDGQDICLFGCKIAQWLHKRYQWQRPMLLEDYAASIVCQGVMPSGEVTKA